MINGGLVIIFAVINLIFLIEYPESKGIKIEENSHLFHEIREIKSEDLNTK